MPNTSHELTLPAIPPDPVVAVVKVQQLLTTTTSMEAIQGMILRRVALFKGIICILTLTSLSFVESLLLPVSTLLVIIGSWDFGCLVDASVAVFDAWPLSHSRSTDYLCYRYEQRLLKVSTYPRDLNTDTLQV